MRSFISNRVQQVPPSGIRRFFDIAATMNDVISLGIGEPDFVTPQPILEAGVTPPFLASSPKPPRNPRKPRVFCLTSSAFDRFCLLAAGA
jgi:hypothetical protein